MRTVLNTLDDFCHGENHLPDGILGIRTSAGNPVLFTFFTVILQMCIGNFPMRNGANASGLGAEA